MLRKEQNDLLTRTAAGTPMGEMFRRYWIPALLAEELPGPVAIEQRREYPQRYGRGDEHHALRVHALNLGLNGWIAGASQAHVDDADLKSLHQIKC